MNNIWSHCPLCGAFLNGQVNGYNVCPRGHYEYAQLGSYAAHVSIITNDVRYEYELDDMFGDWDKFEQKVKEIRQDINEHSESLMKSGNFIGYINPSLIS